MPKLSAKAAARDAAREDKKARDALAKSATGDPQLGAVSTLDSFINMAHKLGIGSDNPTSQATYGFNPITRNRVVLEWIHRGSWLGGVAIDLIANDMTRRGAEFTTEIDPQDLEKLERAFVAYNCWGAINYCIQMGRLYGGAITVALIDGQDPREPLRLDTVGPGQFKGMLTLDRWMLEPSLEDLVTEMGPHLGMPKFYRVLTNAPALRNAVIHHSRVLVRHVGVTLPYHQALQEQLWGISVLERLYDRMVAFDSASTGAAQLVYKAYLRTLSVDGLRDIVAAGGKPLAGLYAYIDNMRRFQGNEGITVIDTNDKFEAQSHQAFSGLSDVIMQFGQQISGALQIPLVRLFGQSPSGLNSSGESDLRTYYDHVRQLQQHDLYQGVTLAYKLQARSLSIELPPNFAINFRPLRELDDNERGEIAAKNTETVSKAFSDGLIDQATAMKELRQSSRVTGVFTNITREDIEQAEMQPPPMPGLPGMPGLDPNNPGAVNGTNQQAGAPANVDPSPRRRVPLLDQAD